jgi:DNA transposition AAA+ family ATPase
MNDAKYIGMDVHQATISAAVRDASGNLVMEATLETKTETILDQASERGNRTRVQAGLSFVQTHQRRWACR